MPIRRLILSVVVAAALAACGGAPGPQSSTIPTAAPVASTGAPATVAAPTVAHVDTFEGLASGLDNMKQARIRATNAGATGSAMDVYINNLAVFNGGEGQQGIVSATFSGWVYVTPGSYTVALAPHGKPITQAWFPPVAVNAVAGHRYTVAVMGHLKDKDIKPLVIDETALAASKGLKPSDHVSIMINNLAGITGMDYLVDGTTTPIPYGAATAIPLVCPNGNAVHPETFTVAGKPDAVIVAGRLMCLPTASYAVVWYGTYPNHVIGGDGSQWVSESTNLVDVLTAFNRHPVVMDDGSVITFNTLVAAIDTAGMRDQFAASDPYFFLAPTDEAFAALPKAQRETLLTDPQALTTLLKAYFIDGYFPSGSLSGATYGVANREVTNRLGQKLRFLSETVNGQAIGPSYTVGNGNRMQVIYTLLPAK